MLHEATPRLAGRRGGCDERSYGVLTVVVLVGVVVAIMAAQLVRASAKAVTRPTTEVSAVLLAPPMVPRARSDGSRRRRRCVGNGGPNLVSSFHVIGAVFDKVYTEAAMGGGPVARNVQTTLIPAGGATIVEFKTVVPGRFLMVDHSLSRALDKGAVGSLVVLGDTRPDVFQSLSPSVAARGGGGH